MNKNTYNSLTPPSPNRIGKEYHPNGKLLSKTHYVNGNKHGMDTVWCEYGTKRTETKWRDGKQHGLETWWRADGQKTREEMQKDGKWHGVWTHWYANDQKKYEAYYLRGEEKARINYDENNNVTAALFPPPTTSTTTTSTNPKIQTHKTQIKNDLRNN